MLLPRKAADAERAGGALRPWPPVLVTWGPGAESNLHAHHCWHAIVALDGSMQVRESARGAARSAPGLVTRPDAPHAVDARGTRVVITFIEPESEVGDRLNAAMSGNEVTVLAEETASPLRNLLRGIIRAPATAGTSISAALSLLGAEVAGPTLRHPAIRRVLRHLRAAPLETGWVTPSELRRRSQSVQAG